MTSAYQRVKSLDWDPTYIAADDKNVEPTRFFVPKKAIDPFKTFVREYFYMEQEKDHRALAIVEGASRVQGGHRDARWIEGMKFALGNLASVEHATGRQVGRMARVVPIELRQGYMCQVMDEMRHSQLEMNVLPTTCGPGKTQRASAWLWREAERTSDPASSAPSPRTSSRPIRSRAHCLCKYASPALHVGRATVCGNGGSRVIPGQQRKSIAINASAL